MAKTGKLLRSLIRAGTRTAKLFAAATAPAKPRKKRAAKLPSTHWLPNQALLTCAN